MMRRGGEEKEEDHENKEEKDEKEESRGLEYESLVVKKQQQIYEAGRLVKSKTIGFSFRSGGGGYGLLISYIIQPHTHILEALPHLSPCNVHTYTHQLPCLGDMV